MRRPQRVAITTSSDEGDNDMEVNDSNEELVAATERNLKCQVRWSADHLEKLIEATWSNHVYPVLHKLKESTIMKNYMTTGTSTGPIGQDQKFGGEIATIIGLPSPDAF
jgi:hypothetical protein